MFVHNVRFVHQLFDFLMYSHVRFARNFVMLAFKVSHLLRQTPAFKGLASLKLEHSDPTILLTFYNYHDQIVY